MRANVIKRGQSRPRHATTVVELAIVGMLLLGLTFATVEYGWMFLKQQQITNTARQAARLACTPDATNTTVQAKVDALMGSYGMGSKGYTQSYSPSDVTTATRGTSVSVTVSVPYANITVTNFKYLLPLPTTVSATVAMQKEGP